ncbi:hypothetical protein CLAFUW4_08388 [Fulvia fulva]|uniref:BTB domain-containing protein n=1 Tax=Passalora fulva TaxID=5499 RepID=A0A9Q8P704_PASFU|nr:uncharacterized protein CLAFUR5_08493 [Fulvia fulva]KAK4629461.1 hypothetical protein CLAFUR4_08393 [Fulvia fulva]KAK4630714.1 hypothetical protein CLAFUR0_08388 [Fulvia fulva]UJO15511.1 hypothetical protein CLAFUR5_08493 [Fulvia fulva]WPV12198.1 hypothetical protein CLAFUW4_08388 [Fulvia fulva]WPV27511.1 hypothetical protein CLAFUW7_08388 [Fulvia fulva]
MPDSSSLVTLAPAAFVQRLAQLREDTHTADLTLKLTTAPKKATRKWRVHRQVLALHSRCLEKAIIDAPTGATLDMAPDEATCIEQLVKYFYTFNYGDFKQEAATSQIPDVVLNRLAKTKEPHRSLQWLRMCFQAENDAEILQVSIWQPFKDLFTPHSAANPLLPAGDFLKIIPQVFPSATAGVIERDGSSAGIVRGVKPRISHVDSSEWPLMLHTKMYLLGVKYEIPHLKQLSVQKFREAIRHNWATTSDFVEAARTAWKAAALTSDTRGVIIQTIRINPALLDRTAPQSELEQAMLEYPEMAVAVAKMALGTGENHQWEIRFRCPNCKTQFVTCMSQLQVYSCVSCGTKCDAVTWMSRRMVQLL